ncbi:MAG: hypothetical protein ONB05_01035 [candidate division KSB1 bacterium]|nr:hypothetical protein [candidate division KSB1 bacterium]
MSITGLAPLEHFWKSCVGAPHQYLIKDSSKYSQFGSTLQNHLIMARNEAGLKRERGHDILCDDVGIYSEDAYGNPVYNWTNLDIIYDFLMSIDVDPTVNLAFMPGALRSNDLFVYRNDGYPSWVSPRRTGINGGISFMRSSSIVPRDTVMRR